MFPHLPIEPVSCILVGERWRSLLEAPLAKYNIQFKSLADSQNVSTPVRGHIDLLIQQIDEKIWVVEPESFLQAKQQFPQFCVLRGEKQLFGKYPQEIAYNGLRIGRHFFHCLQHSDPVVLKQLKQQQVILHSVKQGYAKCAVCPISERAAITADVGMIRALSQVGIDVLQIASGGIQLSGYDTGFIGGSAFLIAPDRLAFTGQISHLEDAGKILAFLKKHQIEAEFLTDKPLFDIGSAMILKS